MKKESKQLMVKKFAFGTFKVVENGKVAVAFDFSKAPIPQDTYSATHASFESGPDHDCFFIFSQVDANSKAIRHKLEVRFDDISVLNLWLNSKEFFRRITTWYSETYGNAPEFRPINIGNGTPSYQVSANLAFMGHQETSAVAAFYYFDPRAAREIAVGNMPDKSLVGSPVVQVKLSTHALWNMLSQVETFVDQLIQKYPKLSDRINNSADAAV